MANTPDDATIARYQKVARDMQKPVDKPHSCSYASSNRAGSLGFGVVLYQCRVCGKEWDKDVS